MTKITSAILVIITLSITTAGLCLASTPQGFYVDPGTRQNCLDGALRARVGFKGTEFENWNFYETCLLNIYCANPMPVCPKEDIKKASAFFLTLDK